MTLSSYQCPSLRIFKNPGTLEWKLCVSSFPIDLYHIGTQSVSCCYKNIFCVCKYLRIYSLSTIVYKPLSKCDKIEKFITRYFFCCCRKKWEYECCQLAAEEDSFLQVFETISNLHLSPSFSYLIERLSYLSTVLSKEEKKFYWIQTTNWEKH